MYRRFSALSAVANRPRDRTVLQTELDDHCDKLLVERRSSEVLSTCATNGGAVYRSLSVHLVELSQYHISTIDLSWRNFQSPEFGAKL